MNHLLTNKNERIAKEKSAETNVASGAVRTDMFIFLSADFSEERKKMIFFPRHCRVQNIDQRIKKGEKDTYGRDREREDTHCYRVILRLQ